MGAKRNGLRTSDLVDYVGEEDVRHPGTAPHRNIPPPKGAAPLRVGPPPKVEKRARRIRITNDGTVRGTKVVDADTGEPIDGVRAVKFVHEVGHAPVVSLEILGAEIDVTALANEYRAVVPTK